MGTWHSGLDSSDSEQCEVVDCFRLASAVNGREFLEQVSNYNLVKKNFAQVIVEMFLSSNIMDFTSSEIGYLSRWHDTTKQPTPVSLIN